MWVGGKCGNPKVIQDPHRLFIKQESPCFGGGSIICGTHEDCLQAALSGRGYPSTSAQKGDAITCPCMSAIRQKAIASPDIDSIRLFVPEQI
jgi:coenzyme F420-reducing hydrogenase gamma subunit